ncbi:hypothetical protein [Algoriphagus winogradskyi]|uniref:DUF1700 domain-containing protein n=1 Tax=Algoriphagus winogradskyi TaxID=237017 RepID=A0ABY1PC79_9BACT|nr:hypothetical protein [Algoriphagus winogradskyi]SMP29526.1 hypothetical protein SAMN06265367_106135 [Algoriphagus winogradskyi]
MRQLSAPELDQVKRAIAAKELTSAEILVEIYDHYVSHLESFESTEFEAELVELEEKFNYSYCHALQAKFIKETKKEIFNLQWSIFKTYFTWPRFLITSVFLVIYFLFWMDVANKTKVQLLIIPIVAIVILSAWIFYGSFKKVSKIKQMIASPKVIQSSLLASIMMQLSLITSSFNLMILLPKVFDVPNYLESPYFIAGTLILSFIYVSYSLTLYEAWKLKTKTALI